MRAYRRRPKPIEALQFTDATAEELERLTGGTLGTMATAPDELVLAMPQVGQGTLTVYLGDYVYRSVNGSLKGAWTKVGPAWFEAEYEPVV